MNARGLPLLRRSLGTALAFSLLILALSPGSAKAQSAIFEEFAVTAPVAGDMAPDFTLRTVDNEEFNLMEAAAEMPVVMEFGSFT
jgi:hypothetical protein